MKQIINNNTPVIIGIGCLPVGEHWQLSLRQLASRAVRQAVRDAGGLTPDAVYIGNVLGNILSHQANLGALVGEEAGLHGIEGTTLEAAGASGAAAFRAACQAVQSGFVDVAVAVGVEKVTECEGSTADAAVNLALNYEYESSQGMSSVAQAALIAQRYLHTYQLERDIFRPVALNSFAHAASNENAMFRSMNEKRYLSQPLAADPLGVFDTAFLADGAAAVVVTRPGLVPAGMSHAPVRVLGSANAIAPLSLHDRADLLDWSAVQQSAASALRQAGLSLSNIDSFECWDGTVMDLILALEGMGLSPAGRGWDLGDLRLNLTGGCLGRGNPLGASGMYQIAETAARMRQEKAASGKSEKTLVQAVGGCGATVITHILGS